VAHCTYYLDKTASFSWVTVLTVTQNKNCPTQSIIAAPIPLLVAKVCKYVFSSVGTDTHAFIEGSGVRLFILLNMSWLNCLFPPEHYDWVETFCTSLVASSQSASWRDWPFNTNTYGSKYIFKGQLCYRPFIVQQPSLSDLLSRYYSRCAQRLGCGLDTGLLLSVGGPRRRRGWIITPWHTTKTLLSTPEKLFSLLLLFTMTPNPES